MKQYIFLIIIIATTIAGCKKHQYTCTMGISYELPTGIIFKGYDSADLSEFELIRYIDTSDMTGPLSRDTLHFSNLFFSADTAFVDSNRYNTFYTLEANIDYKVNLYKAGVIYTITGTHKGPSGYSFEQNEPCRFRNVFKPLQNIHVDGQLTTPVESYEHANDFYIMLSKP